MKNNKQSFLNQLNNFNETIESRADLLTEEINTNSLNLDSMSTSELFDTFNKEDHEPQRAVNDCRNEIIKAIDLITLCLKNGGKIIYLGAGTSGRLGVLDAAECPPTFCTPPELVQGVIAGGFECLYQSSEELEDDPKLAITDLQSRKLNNKDCLIGITAGGTTPYVRSGLSFANKIGCLTIAIACVPSSQAFLECDVDIRLLTGPEIIAGSTRLKAGTATKMTLNILSSSVMIKLGKVYSNRMVDVSASNSKLLDRSLRIIQDLTDLDKTQSLRVLRNANGSVKLALLSVLGNIDMPQAIRQLEVHNDNLRKALNSIN
tara:strand:- start:387 stop:1343 length:957 start_codon:yes stop_codon:yes gene_type:complete